MIEASFYPRITQVSNTNNVLSIRQESVVARGGDGY